MTPITFFDTVFSYKQNVTGTMSSYDNLREMTYEMDQHALLWTSTIINNLGIQVGGFSHLYLSEYFLFAHYNVLFFCFRDEKPSLCLWTKKINGNLISTEISYENTCILGLNLHSQRFRKQVFNLNVVKPKFHCWRVSFQQKYPNCQQQRSQKHFRCPECSSTPHNQAARLPDEVLEITINRKKSSIAEIEIGFQGWQGCRGRQVSSHLGCGRLSRTLILRSLSLQSTAAASIHISRSGQRSSQLHGHCESTPPNR